nr:hypothetical protein [Mycobacterium lepromatosis]
MCRVGCHFGAKVDLIRAIDEKNRVLVEPLRDHMVAELLASKASAEMQERVTFLVHPLTEI